MISIPKKLRQRLLLLIVSICCFSSKHSYGQLDELFDRKTSVAFFMYSTSQKQAGNEIQEEDGTHYFDDNGEYKISSIGFGFEIKRDRAEKGKKSVWYINRFAYDFLTSIWKFNLGATNQVDGLNDFVLTGGLLGNVGLGWNIVGGDKYRVMLGGHFEDYSVATKYFVTANGGFSDQIDYGDGMANIYIGIGPDVKFSYAINDNFGITIPFSISFPFGSYGSPDRDPLPTYFEDIKPKLLTTGFEVISRIGFFTGIDYIKPMTNHPSAASRMDLRLGYKF